MFNFIKCPRRLPNVPHWVSSSNWPALLESLKEKNLAKIKTEFDALTLKKFEIEASSIMYIPLLEQADQFNLCMFYLPQGACLPWHNHPGQDVLGKVLMGSLEVASADLLGVCDLIQTEPAVITPKSPSFAVEPDKNNIHRITALTDTLFLDLVMPPYSLRRTITYYLPELGRFRAVSERHVQIDMQLADINTLVPR